MGDNSTLGAGCLLVFVFFCISVIPVLGLLALSENPDQANNQPTPSDEEVQRNLAAHDTNSSWSPVLLVLGCLGLVAAPIIAWRAIRPLN
jgi:hypothetical protein